MCEDSEGSGAPIFKTSSLLCSRSRGEARLSACSASSPSARKAMAAQGWEWSERRRLIRLLSRGLVTAFRGFFVSGLSSV